MLLTLKYQLFQIHADAETTYAQRGAISHEICDNFFQTEQHISI